MAEVQVRCSGFFAGWRTVISKPVLDQPHEHTTAALWKEPYECRCGARFTGQKQLDHHIAAIDAIRLG